MDKFIALAQAPDPHSTAVITISDLLRPGCLIGVNFHFEFSDNHQIGNPYKNIFVELLKKNSQKVKIGNTIQF